jgi:hypothetical protein
MDCDTYKEIRQLTQTVRDVIKIKKLQTSIGKKLSAKNGFLCFFGPFRGHSSAKNSPNVLKSPPSILYRWILLELAPQKNLGPLAEKCPLHVERAMRKLAKLYTSFKSILLAFMSIYLVEDVLTLLELHRSPNAFRFNTNNNITCFLILDSFPLVTCIVHNVRCGQGSYLPWSFSHVESVGPQS